MAPAGKTVSEVLLETLNATELNETTASLAVHQTMKENGQLFVSNSMAIRYLDRFMDSRPYRMFEIAASTGLMGLFLNCFRNECHSTDTAKRSTDW